MIKRLLSWFQRAVRVERAVEDRDVVLVEVRGADRFYLSRNNFFAMTWGLARAAEKGMTDLSLTMRIPLRGEEEQVIQFKIPEWARRRITRSARKLALEMGWRGECPQPAKTGAYR